MRFILSAICGACLLCFTGCLAEPEASMELPVIEGWFDSDGYPVVIFTSSLKPDDTDRSLAEKVIRWGVVKISDGENEVILTGAPAKDFFPPYRYYTTAMRGVPGKTYTVTADYRKLHASASCTMLPPTPIDSITVENIEGSDSLRAATLFFTSPPDVPAFYYVTVREKEKGARPLPALLGTLRAADAGRKMAIPVYHPKNLLDSAHYRPQLISGEELEVNLCRVTEEVYGFWCSYDNAVLTGNSQFLNNTAETNRGNIFGGYGIWSVQGTSHFYLTVP